MTAPSGDLTSVPHHGQLPYDVIVGHGLAGQVTGLVSDARVVAVVRPDELSTIAKPIVTALADGGHAVHEISVPAGESAKSLPAPAALGDAPADAGVDRHD